MYLTIDIGGTKTLLGKMTKDGSIEKSIKFPTPTEYDEFIKQLEDNIATLTTDKWEIVCVAAPGKIDRSTGSVIAFGNLDWKNVPIAQDLEKIAKTKAIIENDAKLAALSEARALNPPRAKVVYLTVSTGIGSGTVINNVLDPDLIDAEVGHMLFERDGELVKWQSFASGKAIVKRFGKLASEIDDPKIWQIISRDLAIGIIDIVANIQPDIIIIGGGVGSHFHKYGDILNTELKQYESPMVPIPAVVGAKHPEEAVIHGCYQLILDHLQKSD
ncbi:ROK family protein [Candidatus Saccharibacteria bacterium]|nr:ROK family protein [Candidatus Saccharibacteria bacterium]